MELFKERQAAGFGVSENEVDMITRDPTIDRLADQNAVFSIAISGGKDSTVAALLVNDYLNERKHTGPRVLIHSDLGSVEWKDSIRICTELAERLNMPLITVRRQAGGMMQRWQTRWANNVKRYTELSCVKLILPWSTPSMRFCTSELKTAIITRELVKRFRGQQIVTVLGIRREESPGRSKTPVTKINTALTRKDGTCGVDWNPIVDMTLDQVFLAHQMYKFRLHEAYTQFGSSRVSCSFCIMSRRDDLIAASQCEDNADIYREMCELELTSAFSFQSTTWLSDTAPHLLTDEQRKRIDHAKQIAVQRAEVESEIPKHLLFTANWPEVIPLYSEAHLLVRVRSAVAEMQGLRIHHTDPVSLIQRYRWLMAEKERRAR